MKKVLIMILAAVIALTFFSFPAFADEEKLPDGFDFYSMTAYYEVPVVLSYKYVTKSDQIQKKDIDGNPMVDDEGEPVYVDKGYVFDDAADKYIVPIVGFTTKDGSFTNYAPTYGEKAIGKGKYEIKFYSVMAPAYEMDSSKIAVNKGYGLTHIGDNTAVSIISAATLYGASEFYDDAGTPNPNFTLKDGYFLDQEVDADGNNLRIDVNGYVIDANNIWHSRDGHRIEPFVQIGEDENKREILVWIDLQTRLDEKGRVRDYTSITNQELLDKGVITMPEKYATLADEFDATVDYDGDEKVGSTKDKTAYKKLVKEKNSWLEGCSIQMYTLDYIDLNGDGKKTDDDMAYFYDENANGEYDEGEAYGYNHPKLKVTQDLIMTKADKNGKLLYVQGSPAIGNPLSKVKISKLTVEIDALGEKLYDVAEDPQQQNEIIITTGDIYKNIEKAQAYVAEHPEKMYTDGQVLGRAKCVTTKTEYTKLDLNYPETMKSVDVVLEEGSVIPANATLYFNFVVKTEQTEHEFEYYKKKDYNLFPINKGEVDLTRIPNAPVEATPEPEPNKCGVTIAGGIAVVAVMAVAFIGLKKKED